MQIFDFKLSMCRDIDFEVEGFFDRGLEPGMKSGNRAGVEWRIGDHAESGEGRGISGAGNFAEFFENSHEAIAPIGEEQRSVNLPTGDCCAEGRQ